MRPNRRRHLVVIIATVNAIGSTLNAKFDYISQQLK
jgi:Flp pilus assembly pilin Flp